MMGPAPRTPVVVILPRLETAAASRMSKEEHVDPVDQGSSTWMPRMTLAAEVWSVPYRLPKLISLRPSAGVTVNISSVGDFVVATKIRSPYSYL